MDALSGTRIDAATGPSAPEAVVPREQTLPEMLRSCAADAGERIALVSGSRRLSYAELATQMDQVAAGLAEAGVRPGDRVALLAPNVPEWVLAAFGALAQGARVDAFNTWVKAYDLDYLLRTSEVSTLMMVDHVRNADLLGELLSLVPELDAAGPGEWRSARYPALRRVVVIGDRVPRGALPWADVSTATGTVDEPGTSGDDAAFVLYTSGSTKNPKAVPLDHRNLVLNGFHIGERMGLSEDDRVWLGSPLFWSYGCANALMATFTHRARLVLQERFEPRDAVALMGQEGVTAAYFLPAMTEVLAATCPGEVRALAALRTGLTIGRREEVERVAVDLGVGEICNVYGATENYGNCCVTDHRMPLEQRLSTQGHPLPGVEVRIVDESTGMVLGPDEAGEAQIRGRITKGYLGDDEANAQAFTADGWYRSSIVVGTPDAARGEVVVAFVVSRDPGLTSEDLITYCRERIASYKVPRHLTILDQLPRTGTGKVARRMLHGPAAELVAQAQDQA